MEKRNKKILLIGIITTLLILIVATLTYFIFNTKEEPKEEIKQNANTPLLYEVTKDTSDTTIYLFGSIHVGDKNAYPMPETIENAYKKSDYLAVEIDVIEFEKDMEAQMKMANSLLYTDGRTITSSLKEETYNLLVDYTKENKEYMKIYEQYKPAFWESLIQTIMIDEANLKSELGIDMHFLEKAKKDKKEIIELETPEQQTNLMTSFSDEYYDMSINYALKNKEESIKALKDMYTLWLKGDEQNLLTYIEADVKDLTDYENAEKLLEEYNKEMITKRNIEMGIKTDTYYKEGKNIFLVVGLAHIIGKDGLVNLLKDKGYNVEKVIY